MKQRVPGPSLSQSSTCWAWDITDPWTLVEADNLVWVSASPQAHSSARDQLLLGWDPRLSHFRNPHRWFWSSPQTHSSGAQCQSQGCKIWGCCSVAQSYPIICNLWTAVCQAFLSFTISCSLLKFMSTELMMSSNHLILCLALLFLPSVFPSYRVFSYEPALHIRWPKYWSFSFSIGSFQWIQCWFPLGLTDLISLHSKGLSRVFSSTTVGKHQFFIAQPSLRSSSHVCTWLFKKL